MSHYANGSKPEYPVGFFGVFRDHTGKADITNLDSAMCALFGGHIKKAITEFIDTMPWPDEGLPESERIAKIENLTIQKRKVNVELNGFEKHFSTLPQVIKYGE